MDKYSEIPKHATTKPNLWISLWPLFIMFVWNNLLYGGYFMVIAIVFLFWMPIIAGVMSYRLGISIAKIYYANKDVKKNANTGAHYLAWLAVALVNVVSLLVTFLLRGVPVTVCVSSCSTVSTGFLIAVFCLTTTLAMSPIFLGVSRYFKWVKKYNLPDVDYISNSSSTPEK